MIGIQIVAVLFALIMLYLSYLHFKRNEFKKTEFIFWTILWLGLILITLVPTSVNFIVNTFSFSRAFDFVVVVGIVVVFGVTFRNYIIVKRLQKKIEDYTREQSLSKIKDK